jgi:predicted nuclease of predicted toxin-antitoxin system
LLLDEDIHLELAEVLRSRGVDAIHVQEAGRKGFSDEEQLSFAAKNRRSLCTFNVRDFVLLHNAYVSADLDHFGIIVSKQVSLRVAMASILRLTQSHTLESLKNALIFLKGG